MGGLLEIIRLELAGARRRVSQLEEMEHLAIAMTGDVREDAATQAPPATAVGCGVSPPATGVVGCRVDNVETRNSLAGRNGHQDAPPAAKPARPKDPSALDAATPHPRTAAAARAREDHIVTVVREHGPLTPRDLARRLDGDWANVRTPVGRLIKAGRLVATGNTTRRRLDIPTTERDRLVAARNGKGTPLARLREQVLDTINHGPRLTETELADRLQADREDVASVCGEHLDANLIALQPDGTYLPSPARGGVPTTVPPTVPAAHRRLQDAREQVTA